ncbi:MAG: hypothetical protein JO250_24435 [Armatimonadetes bacterium]|nr:hypothetical protein [Armatimonadota bacterium]
MKRFLKRFLAAAFCLIAMAGAGAGGARAADLVWFCPNDSRLISSSSYDSQWPRARSRVRVYKFYYQVIRDSPVAELRAKFQWLKAHHIALAVEWPAMTWTENGAGDNVEGFNPAGTSQALAQKIQSAGGTLGYVAMDEPLYYGHYDSGPHCAHWPLATIVANVVANMRQVWAIFPHCEVGDIEPVDAMPTGDALAMTSQWADAFRGASGRPLAFLHDDILWGAGWRQSIPKLAAMLAVKKVAFGVIFNATGDPSPDARWMESAEINVQSYNAAKVPKPRQIVFQTWYPLPSAVLPETAPSAFSSLILYYYGPYAKQPPPVPFLRLYSATLNRHLYTTDARRITGLKSHGWILEPPAGNVYLHPGGAAGLIPLYQLSGGPTDHLFTTSLREKANLFASGHRNEGVAGYVFAAGNPAGRPLYHAGSPQFQDFYTCNPDEYAGLAAPMWQREGITCAMP